MKPSAILLFLIIFLPLVLKAQVDTIRRPGIFDEGYFFIGPGDVLKFKGYVQTDAYFPSRNSPGITEFLIRRARFAVTGFFQQNFRYMLYARYDRGRVSLNEAFLESRHLPFARIRVGQYKVPFSLSNLKSSSQLDFVSRSFIVENFSPNYDIGAMIFGEGVAKSFDYAVGVFNGTGPNKRDNNNSKTFVARLVVSPFSALKNTAFEKFYAGGSFARGKQNNDIGNTNYQLFTETPVYTFNDSIRQQGTTRVYGYDLEWLVKNISVKGEYLNYWAENLAKNATPFDFAANGFYVTATYVLTAEEKKRNENVKPKKPFDPKKGGWGAFELAARYEKANLSNTVVRAGMAGGLDGLRAGTVGLNWYLNDDVKVVMNYQNYVFGQQVAIEAKTYSKSSFLLLRVQYQF